MQIQDVTNLKNKLIKSYKYRDYETAIYLSMYLSPNFPEFNLLTGILLYENHEYSRSLFHLANLHGTTAVFYKCLNYKKLKKYNEAIVELVNIVEHKTVQEVENDNFITTFLVNLNDIEYFDSLLGSLLILKGKSKLGIEKYRKSFIKNPLLNPCFCLFDENVYISPTDHFKFDPIMILYQDIFKLSVQKHIENLSIIPSSINDFLIQYSDLNKYYINIPGIGSYYFSKIASMYCKLTQSLLGMQIFEHIRNKDPTFILEMDVYSTSLWINKDLNLLGILAKDLISTSPYHYITWSVIGNFYSLNGMPKESTTCLMKSLSIQENPFAYSLLGFEFNIRNQYLEAQNYFKSSLCMLENNDKANFGLGVSYCETSKKTTAEAYFKKALSINPSNLNMKAFLVRFYVKNDELKKAILKIKEYLNINCDTVEEMAEIIYKNSGSYNEIEELIICEFIEILVKEKYKNIADKLLECIQLRTSTYYSKKNLVESDK